MGRRQRNNSVDASRLLWQRWDDDERHSMPVPYFTVYGRNAIVSQCRLQPYIKGMRSLFYLLVEDEGLATLNPSY